MAASSTPIACRPQWGRAVRENILRLMLKRSRRQPWLRQLDRSPRSGSLRAKACASHDAYVRKMVFRTYALCVFTMVFCVNAPAPLFELFRRPRASTPLNYRCSTRSTLALSSWPCHFLAAPATVSVVGRWSSLAWGLLRSDHWFWRWRAASALLVSGRLLQGLGVAAMSAPAASALAELAGKRKAGVRGFDGGGGPRHRRCVSALVFRHHRRDFPGFPTSPLLVCAGMAIGGLVSVALLPDPGVFGASVPASSLPADGIAAIVERPGTPM